MNVYIYDLENLGIYNITYTSMIVIADSEDDAKEKIKNSSLSAEDYDKESPILIATITGVKDVFTHSSNYEGMRLIMQ